MSTNFFTLHPFQDKLRHMVLDAWTRVNSVLLVLATGGGKTVIFSKIMHDHNGAAAAVVHRREIVAQIAMSLAHLGVKHRIVAPAKVVKLIRRKQLRVLGQSFVDPHAECGVVSVQTLAAKSADTNQELQRWIKSLTLCVFDEGHHYIKSGHWARAVMAVSAALLLFVTATPERADGKGLGIEADGFVEEMVEGPQTQWLIEHGFLSRFRYHAPLTDLDVSGLASNVTGEFSPAQLRKRVVDSHLVGDVVEHYHRFAKGKKTIVFATDVTTAHEIADRLKASGVTAVALDGKTDVATREAELADFEGGRIDVLVNVDLFDEGFDVPSVEAIMLARPTESLSKFLQMIGRGLRVLEGKLEAIIIDPVRNWERHGAPNWPRVWSLTSEDRATRASSSDMMAQKICVNPMCTQPYEAYHKVCPYCGTAPVVGGRAQPKQVDGDLFELDVEGMAALFNQIEAADMPDEEYQHDQVARNIPPTGRGLDLRRHQAAKYRRKVLKELVAWWIGVQPADRDMAEKHRRFYHRFGIDIGTAFTLNAKDTDQLADKIKERFTYDLVG